MFSHADNYQRVRIVMFQTNSSASQPTPGTSKENPRTIEQAVQNNGDKASRSKSRSRKGKNEKQSKEFVYSADESSDSSVSLVEEEPLAGLFEVDIPLGNLPANSSVKVGLESIGLDLKRCIDIGPDEELLSLSDKVPELNKILDRISSVKAIYENSIKDNETEMESMEEEINNLKKENEQMKKNMENIFKKHSELVPNQDEANLSKKEIRRLNKLLEKAEVDKETMQKTDDDRSRRMEELEDKIKQQKEMIEKLEKDSQCKKEVEELKKLLEEQKKETEKLKNQVVEAEKLKEDDPLKLLTEKLQKIEKKLDRLDKLENLLNEKPQKEEEFTMKVLEKLVTYEKKLESLQHIERILKENKKVQSNDEQSRKVIECFNTSVKKLDKLEKIEKLLENGNERQEPEENKNKKQYNEAAKTTILLRPKQGIQTRHIRSVLENAEVAAGSGVTKLIADRDQVIIEASNDKSKELIQTLKDKEEEGGFTTVERGPRTGKVMFYNIPKDLKDKALLDELNSRLMSGVGGSRLIKRFDVRRAGYQNAIVALPFNDAVALVRAGSLFVGLRRVRVARYFALNHCKRCYSWYHKESHCPCRGGPYSGACSKTHEPGKCIAKELCCRNCSLYNKGPNITRPQDEKHHAASRSCPAYKEALYEVIHNTN